MYNTIIVMGRIVNDLELNVAPQGVNVCSFRIAVDRRYQTKGEEKKTDFFNVVAWRKHTEFVEVVRTHGIPFVSKIMAGGLSE